MAAQQRYVVKYAFTAEMEGELTVNEGEMLELVGKFS